MCEKAKHDQICIVEKLLWLQIRDGWVGKWQKKKKKKK